MIPKTEMAALFTQMDTARDQRLGGNSKVVRANWRGRSVAIKDYSARDDARIRIEREWEGLSLLWSLGLRLAPEPLGVDPVAGYGVQEWIPGSPPVLDFNGVRFLGSVMQEIHEASQSIHDFGMGLWAADAIHHVGDMRDQVAGRITKLNAAQGFIWPRLLDSMVSATETLETLTTGGGEWIPTLSPSDFGLHNVLHDDVKDGWRIIDLEFFGWDDAHKLVCDTLMHPLMTWQPDLALKFISSADAVYGLDFVRLMCLYPWCSLKWGTIVANRALREQKAGRQDEAKSAVAAANSYIMRAIESGLLSRDATGLETLLHWEPNL